MYSFFEMYTYFNLIEMVQNIFIQLEKKISGRLYTILIEKYNAKEKEESKIMCQA